MLDKMLGLTLPVGGYAYRNVEMDVWRRGIEEQKQADADRAKKLQEGALIDATGEPCAVWCMLSGALRVRVGVGGYVGLSVASHRLCYVRVSLTPRPQRRRICRASTRRTPATRAR